MKRTLALLALAVCACGPNNPPDPLPPVDNVMEVKGSHTTLQKCGINQVGETECFTPTLWECQQIGYGYYWVTVDGRGCESFDGPM